MAPVDGAHGLLVVGGALCTPACECLGDTWQLVVPPVAVLHFDDGNEHADADADGGGGGGQAAGSGHALHRRHHYHGAATDFHWSPLVLPKAGGDVAATHDAQWRAVLLQQQLLTAASVARGGSVAGAGRALLEAEGADAAEEAVIVEEEESEAEEEAGPASPGAGATRQEGGWVNQHEEAEVRARARAKQAARPPLRPAVADWLAAALMQTQAAAVNAGEKAAAVQGQVGRSMRGGGAGGGGNPAAASLGAVDSSLSPAARYRHSLVAEYRRGFLATLVRAARLLQRLRFVSFSHGLQRGLEEQLVAEVAEVVEGEEEGAGGFGDRQHEATRAGGPSATRSSVAVLFGGESYGPSTYYDDAWVWAEVEDAAGAASGGVIGAAAVAAAAEGSGRRLRQHLWGPPEDPAAEEAEAASEAARSRSLSRVLLLLAGLWAGALPGLVCAYCVLVRAARRVAARDAAAAGAGDGGGAASSRTLVWARALVGSCVHISCRLCIAGCRCFSGSRGRT